MDRSPTHPQEDVVACGGKDLLKHAMPEKDASGDGATNKRPKPQEEEVAAPASDIVVSMPPADRNEDDTKLLDWYEINWTDRKVVKKRVRVRQEVIDYMLQNPPTDIIDPSQFDPSDPFQANLLRAAAFTNNLIADEWDVLHQYHTKGYAEIEKYVFEDDA